MANKRTTQTLTSILLAHQHTGQLPYLKAVATIYTNLLASNATDAQWQLFNKVATLPLLTTHFIKACMVPANYCYGHRGCVCHTVEWPTTVELQQTDTYLLHKGRQINGHEQAWQGRQLANALAAALS